MSFISKVTAALAKNLEVAVGAGRNPDMAPDPNYPVVPTKKVKVASIEEAIEVCRKFIDDHNVGGGSWGAAGGGWIYSKGKKMARVAYNGKVFDLNDKPWKEN